MSFRLAVICTKPAAARAQSLLYASIHCGEIEHRAVEGILSISEDDLAQESTADLVQKIKNLIRAEQVSLVGGSADRYALMEELISLLSIP